ncbi:MAG: hypothetical protein EBX24_08180 [Actinobacteria bacterium]|nr:hypothetical protein [Actinomycetota bacterium]
MSLILITGAESVLVDREITRLVNSATNSEVTRLDGSDMEVGAFADATAPSLFSEARILVVRDLQDLIQDCYLFMAAVGTIQSNYQKNLCVK